MQAGKRNLALRVPAFVLALAATSIASAQLRRIGIDLTPTTETDAAHAGTTTRAAVEARLEKGYHVNSNQPLDPFLIPTVLTLDPPPGITVEATGYPEPRPFKVSGIEEPLLVYEETFAIGVALRLAEDLPAGAYTIPGTLGYQACDEKLCYAPSEVDVSVSLSVVPRTQPLATVNSQAFDGLVFEAASADPADIDRRPGEAVPSEDDADVLSTLAAFDIRGTTGGYLGADDFLEFIRRAETGERDRGLFEGRGPLTILILTLLGGLALNLTPCVLPMIPINLAIIGAGSQAGGSRVRGFALGSAYGLAMAAAYGALGLAVILTAGTFGTINASPWFNLGIAVLFVVLALAMFDVITIDFSRLQAKVAVGGAPRHSFLIAFGMGGVAALLAGACVAPVVIQVIVFASNLYATGTTVALGLPFLLGLGMALPWPIAGAGLSFLPKPGPWMVRVKQAFGVFILGTAIYYGYLSYGLFSQRWVDADEVASSVQALMKEGWYGSLAEGLRAAQRENKPVLVDMWATWCKNCLTMDRTTLQDPAVKAALGDYVKVKFQAEDPGASPVREVMAHFEAIGLPTYAILHPQ